MGVLQNNGSTGNYGFDNNPVAYSRGNGTIETTGINSHAVIVTRENTGLISTFFNSGVIKNNSEGTIGIYAEKGGQITHYLESGTDPLAMTSKIQSGNGAIGVYVKDTGTIANINAPIITGNSTASNTTAGTAGNATAATTDATSDILSTTTITLYDSDGNTVSVERTIYKNYDCEYVDADGMEYSTDDDVYFTDENGKTYQSLNDSTHYFGAELEQHVLQDANGNSVTVTETTNGDYYYMDDNGTGYIDNGDGTWTDENGNSYTE